MAYNANNEPIYTTGSQARAITPIWGRRLGLDFDNMLVGPPEHKLGVTTPTTGGTGSPLPAHGITNLNATAATTAYMDAPIAGIRKTIALTGTGTSQAVVLNAGNFYTSAGSSFRRAIFQTTGDFLQFIGITSAIAFVTGWAMGSTVAAGTMSFTTST